MYIPHGGRGARDERPGDTAPVGAPVVEYFACGLLGLVATSLLVLLFYPFLLAVTRPLQMLSSTAIVLLFVVLWTLVWLGIEIVWDWRTGRATSTE
jgi:hypothetical protein